MRRLVSVVVFSICATNVWAQADSIMLDELTVVGLEWQSFATGVKISPLTPDSLSTGQSLADLLQAHGMAYLKTYGSGQLSTLNIRGTGASQNAIFWQGINSNVTSLGLSDFSISPMALVDQASVQYGAGSSLLGSDVIGGSVHLTTVPRRTNALAMTLSQGSFGLWGTQTRATYYRQQWSAATRVFYQSSDNDFVYRNESVPGRPKARMENAAYQQMGASQDVWYQANDRHRISAHLWYQMMDRQIQPGLYSTQKDHQDDETVRGLIQWAADYGSHRGNLKIARLQDRIDFNGDASVMPRTYIAYEHEYFGNEVWTARAGFNWQLLSAAIDAYSTDVSEQRQDVFFSVGWHPSSRLDISANVRQSFVEGFDPPVTPSVGWAYMLADGLTWTGNLSRSYRVPTLNDRYWRPGGNTQLRPESGRHAETGVEIDHLRFAHVLSAYYGDVADWIIWLPLEGYWSPDNIDQVEIYGVEYQGTWEIHQGLTARASYALNQSIRKSGAVAAFEGRQLPYVPRHQIKWSLTYRESWWSVRGNGQWTSQRFTNADNSTALAAFMMVDVVATAKISEAWSFQFKANNITNEQYQLVLNRPMPGRNYQISVQHQLNFSKGS